MTTVDVLVEGKVEQWPAYYQMPDCDDRMSLGGLTPCDRDGYRVREVIGASDVRWHAFSCPVRYFSPPAPEWGSAEDNYCGGY